MKTHLLLFSGIHTYTRNYTGSVNACSFLGPVPVTHNDLINYEISGLRCRMNIIITEARASLNNSVLSLCLQIVATKARRRVGVRGSLFGRYENHSTPPVSTYTDTKTVNFTIQLRFTMHAKFSITVYIILASSYYTPNVR